MKDLTRKEVLLLGLYAALALTGLRWLGVTLFAPNARPTSLVTPVEPPVPPVEVPVDVPVEGRTSSSPEETRDVEDVIERLQESVQDAAPREPVSTALPRTRVLLGRVIGQGEGGRALPLLIEPLALARDLDPQPRLESEPGPRFTYSEEDGSFSVRDLRAGSWVIRVASGDEGLPSPISERLASRAQQFEVDEGCSHQLELQLLPTHAVRISSSTPEGLPLAYVLLDELNFVLRRGVLDRRRPPTFELVAGDYVLRLRESAGSVAELPFALRPGDPEERVLPLESALR